MHKDEFLHLLAQQVEDGERERVSGYYAEIIDDRVEAGEEEAAVIASFGDVRELARVLDAERRVREFNQKPTMSGGIKALIAAACLFASPIALPLIVVLLIVVVTLHVNVFSVLCSLVAAMVAVSAGGLWLIISGVVTMFANLWGGLFGVGCGLAALGLGVLASYGSVKLLVWCGKCTVRLWKAVINKLMRKKGGSAHEDT
jgi:uncharacterized membrane protein